MKLVERRTQGTSWKQFFQASVFVMIGFIGMDMLRWIHAHPSPSGWLAATDWLRPLALGVAAGVIVDLLAGRWLKR